MTLTELNCLSRERFTELLGWIFEQSPWVAHRAWTQRPFSSAEVLLSTMFAEVRRASVEEQLALLRAHPDLGAKARMSDASVAEQKGAGLDQLSPAEYDALLSFNRAYRDKFGFPFLFAVKGSTKHQILAELRRRLESTYEAEMQEALRQVSRIARFRLETMNLKHRRNYYGKGDVTVYRLQRKGIGAVFGANVTMLIYGDAFWPTYSTGDNTGLIATDSMKNFIQHETMNFSGSDLEGYCAFLCEKFLAHYPQAEGGQVSAVEIPYASFGATRMAFSPGGAERSFASVEMGRVGDQIHILEVRSAIRGFRMLRLGGSAFHGFVRDQYTTLPDIHNRPLHMWLDVEWTYVDSESPFNAGETTKAVRAIVRNVFDAFESGSIQQVLHRIGSRMLDELSSISQVDLQGNNRTWDTVVEQEDELGVYTDSRPPFGILGLSLRR